VPDLTEIRIFVEQFKARRWTWLEDVCILWVWTCLTPMWTTDVNPDYLAIRRQEATRRVLLKSVPHGERRGLDRGSWGTTFLSKYRPSLWNLFVVVPAREMLSRSKKNFTIFFPGGFNQLLNAWRRG